MKVAIFSDVHANLPALEALFEELDQRDLDAIYCLGDLVGYAPWPNEVVRAIRARRIPTIAGNYDVGVGANSDDCGCAYRSEREKELGARSIAFTNETVAPDVRRYLHHLPRHLRIVVGDEEKSLNVLLVHGSPRRVNEYLFEDRPDSSLLRLMEQYEADVMLFGHTHKPYHRVLTSEENGARRTRHAINTGSVGKPKDGDPRACYVLLEVNVSTEGGAEVNVDIVRVPYDVERAARAVEASPLPDEYAQMLREAR